MPSLSPHVRAHGAVVALGAIAKSSSFAGQSFWLAAFVDPLLGATGLSRAGLSLAYAAATVLSATLATILGRLADRRGVVAAWAIAGTGLVAGCLGLAAATGFLTACAALAMVRAFGQGGMPLVGTLAVIRGMSEPRGGAMSITNGSLTIAGVVTPVIAAVGIEVIGWRETMVAAAAFLALVMAGGILFARRYPVLRLPARTATHVQLPRHPEGHHEPLDQEVPVEVAEPDARSGPKVGLGLRGVVLLYMLALVPLTVTAVVFHAFEIGRSSDVGGVRVAAALSGMALVGLAGAVAAGQIYDRRGLRSVLLLLTVLVTVGPAALVWSAPAGFYLGYALLGVAAGVSGVTGSVAWSCTFGDEHVGRFQGIGAAGVIIGAAIGPLAPSLTDVTDGPAWLWLAALGVAGAVGLVLAALWQSSWEHGRSPTLDRQASSLR